MVKVVQFTEIVSKVAVSSRFDLDGVGDWPTLFLAKEVDEDLFITMETWGTGVHVHPDDLFRAVSLLGSPK